MSGHNRLPRITRNRAIAELLHKFPAAKTYALDATYTVVDHEFFKVWQEAFKKRLKTENLGLHPLFDCDDYAALAKSEAAILHMQLARTDNWGGQGVGVGLLCYQQEGEEHRGHAVCIIRMEIGWVAWDPSADDFYVLDDIEKEGAWLILL